MSEYLPSADGPRIRDTTIADDEILVLSAGSQVTRIHLLGGPHPSAWNAFRKYGPTTSRFDHHPPPPREHSNKAVAYFTHGPGAFTAAVAEFFQDDAGRMKPIDRDLHQPHISVIKLAGELRLLDLTSGWTTRAGGNQAICSGARSAAREWARAIHRHHRQHIHGVAWTSSVWGPGRCIAVWEHGTSAMPASPLTHRALNDAVLDVPVHTSAQALGTSIAT